MNTNIFDDYDEQSQEMLKGLNFLSLNDVNRGITTEDPFKNIRTTKTARKISNEIAMESPFGKRSAFYKPLVVAQTINTLETFKVTIRIMVDDDLSLVRDKYKTETVEDHTIKLYIAVEDETLVVKQHHDDLRHAGIRLSNIIEISGVVLGDKIFARFNDNPEEKENYITKIAQDLIDVDSQLEPLKALLKEKFDYYMAHKRSTLFPLGLVGQLIQQELKKDLQEFWKPVLNSIAKEIRTLKMDDEKYWQPYTPDEKLKSISKFTPLVGKAFTNKESYIQSFLQPFDQIDKLFKTI